MLISLWAQMLFPTATSCQFYTISSLYSLVLEPLLFVWLLVVFSVVSVQTNIWTSRNSPESQLMEVIWTIFPVGILFFMLSPSLEAVYELEDSNFKNWFFVKAIGHQWYWDYEVATTSESSYMETDAPTLRTLQTSSVLVVPTNPTRVLVTSEDVIHAWAVPSLGVKVDACPGRINYVNFHAHAKGLMFGQCSEICGANHSFMPISVKVV